MWWACTFERWGEVNICWVYSVPNVFTKRYDMIRCCLFPLFYEMWDWVWDPIRIRWRHKMFVLDLSVPVNGVIQNVTALFVFEAEWRIYVLMTWCIIGSDTGLSHVGSQVMIWTTVSTLLIGRVSGIWVKMQQFSSTKMHLKITPGKWQFMGVLIYWCTCLYTWLRVSCEWPFYFYLVLSFMSTLQGLFSQSVTTSYRQISWSLEAVRLDVIG